MIPLLPLAAGGLLLLLFGRKAEASTSEQTPAPVPAQPANRTGDVPGRDPEPVKQIAQAATKAAEIIQAADRPGPGATSESNLLLACQELELHLKANRPGTERPAMVATVQTLGGLKSDGKYGPMTALLMARTLKREPPAPRYGSAAALAQYKRDLSKALGTSPGQGVVPPPDSRNQQTRATSEWRYGDPIPGEKDPGTLPAPFPTLPQSTTPAATSYGPGRPLLKF